MTHIVRITALLAAFAAAGCTVNAEVAQTSPVATEASSLYSEMHSAIPARRTQGNVFEYHSAVSEKSPVAKNASWVYAEMHAAIPAARIQGNVFEYN